MGDVQTDVALFGAAGYAGLELVQAAGACTRACGSSCAASDGHAGRPVGELTGGPVGRCVDGGLRFVTTEEALATTAGCGAALLAVPPEPAKALAPRCARPGRG